MSTDELLAAVIASYRGAADAQVAAAQRAYMRDQFPYLGISTPERRKLTRDAVWGTPHPGTNDCAELALRCWELSEREFRYFAVDYLVANVKYCDSTLLPTLNLVATMDAWVRDENLWIARTAILYQLHYKAETDENRLFEYCSLQAGHKDFFIRKAIGWALREYAYTAPDAVRAFLEREKFSPLSVREASKHL